MGKVANDPADTDRSLPVATASLAEQPLVPAMTVARMLTLPALAGASVVAGLAGLERPVRRANVMEVPDIISWVRPESVLLTTGYPLRESGADLGALVAALDQRGVSALAIKLHRYLDELPASMLYQADRCGLPLVVVPDQVGFDDILTQVFAGVASERATLLERREDLHRQLVNAVLAGGGLDQVVAIVSELFAGLAMVTTADGRVISRAGSTTWWDRLCVSSLFHPSGRFRTEATGPGLHAVDDLPGSHAVVTVTGGRVDHGRLVLFHDQQRLTGEDLTVLERAGDVAAICLAKELAVSAVESKYRGDFLRDVLAGRAGDQAEVLAHARSLGWDLERPLVVVAAALETEDAPPRTRGFQRPLEVERFSAAWSTVVAGDDPSIAVVGFASEVVALLPVPQNGERAGAQAGSEREVVAAVVAAIRGDGGGGRRRFAAGVSRVTGSLTDLPAAYEQARKTLHAGRRLHGPETVAHFDDLGVFRLLSLIEDDAELDRFVAETLRGLAADPEHGSGDTAGLRETLQVLLDTNLNVAETARTLHFHYNTLRYRIGKIERMVGPFTSDPNLRLDLALALRIVAMRTL